MPSTDKRRPVSAKGKERAPSEEPVEEEEEEEEAIALDLGAELDVDLDVEGEGEGDTDSADFDHNQTLPVSSFRTPVASRSTSPEPADDDDGDADVDADGDSSTAGPSAANETGTVTGTGTAAGSVEGSPSAAGRPKTHWKVLMREREKTAPRCRVLVHVDDARDKVLMGIVRALIKTGNIPSTPKELTAMILHWKIVRMGGATPHATISSRISQHFKRCAEANPPREPILGAWAAEGVRRLRYFITYKGVPVPDVPKSRLEYKLQLEIPGKETPEKTTTPNKRSQKGEASGVRSRAGTPASSAATTPSSLQRQRPPTSGLSKTVRANLPSVDVADEDDHLESDYATPDGLRPHPQIPAAATSTAAAAMMPLSAPNLTSSDPIVGYDETDTVVQPRPNTKRKVEEEPVAGDEQRVPDSTLVSPSGPQSRGQTPKARKSKKPRTTGGTDPDIFGSDFLTNIEAKLQSPKPADGQAP